LNRAFGKNFLTSASLLRLPGAVRRFQRVENERGTNLVEYAIVLTLLLMVLFGLIDFGRALYAYHFVSNAAREGTRYAMVRGSTCTPGCTATSSDIQSYLKNVPTGIDPTQLTVTPTWPGTNPTCTGGNPKAPGCVVEVQVSYNFNFMLPFLPKSTVVMQSSSQMVISQ
jgi:Flp pilus assembly protein TadG